MVRTAWESDEEAILSAEEADRAWDSSRVPASLHATTRHREGSRRRVLLGELEKSSDSVEERWGSFSKRGRGGQSLGLLPGASVHHATEVGPSDGEADRA